MKNDDLIWVRENAGLSQKQASELLGVSRRSFIRWETGDTPIPKVKWNAFLIKVNTSEEAIPKKKEENPDPVAELMGEDWPGVSLESEEWPDELYDSFIVAVMRTFGGQPVPQDTLKEKILIMQNKHDVNMAVENLVSRGFIRRGEKGGLSPTEKWQEYKRQGLDLIG